MKTWLDLPYGRAPYRLRLPERSVVADLPTVPGTSSLRAAIAGALDRPVGAPRLEDSVKSGDAVTIIVSDATRDDPRDAMVRALLARMPADIRLTIAIANGTHAPGDIAGLGLGADLIDRATVVNHDGHDDVDLIDVGITPSGTPIRLHRCAIEAELVIATGRIKPHYFAGFAAGCKSIFPGLGGNREIRINHDLKSEAGARAGNVDGNPCRDDLEEAAELLRSRTFLLNVVVDHHGQVHGAVSGALKGAFRAGVALCEPLYEVEAPGSKLVVVSDALPLTASLYQASKLVAAAAPLLDDGGTLVLVAECTDGIGPVDTVNKAIYEIGVKPRLPGCHRLVLVSSLSRAVVEQSYCDWAPSVEVIADQIDAPMVVLPRAGDAIVKRTDA